MPMHDDSIRDAPRTGVRRWVELHREDGLADAMIVVTSVAAMEYDVRLVAADGRVINELPDEFAESHDGTERISGPFLVQVRAGDWPDLIDVLEPLIDEQREFDHGITQRERVRSGLFILGMAGTAAVVGVGMYRTIRAMLN